MKRVRFFFAMGLALVASPSCVASSQLVHQSDPKATPVIEVAPGLTYSRSDRFGEGGKITWFLSLGVIRNPQEQETGARCASQLGLRTKALPFVFSGSANQAYSEIVAGDFPSRSAAQHYLYQHPVAAPCVAEIKASGVYSTDQSAPMVIHVLTLDPSKFKGQLVAKRGTSGAAGRALPSGVMKAWNGLAATNGGYFVMEPGDGVTGESAGISVIAGQLESESTRNRPWVEIENRGRLRVAFHSSEPTDLPALTAGGRSSLLLDGVNREPGILRNCGALYDKIFAEPIHDVTCKPKSEIVAIVPGAKMPVPHGADRLVFQLTKSGRLIPYNPVLASADYVAAIVATGQRRRELQTLVDAGMPVDLYLGSFAKRDDAYAINGGPLLLSHGMPQRLADSEGWPMLSATWDQANAMHRFVTLRAPRTAIGTTASGIVLIVVVDGWRYLHDGQPPIPMNGGATIAELADVMHDLGAIDALNLDGGGSSVMALRTGVISHPSDSYGERAVGDSLVVLPSSR